MTARWSGVTIDCLDPQRVAAFWSALLGRPAGPTEPGWVYLGSPDDVLPRLVFQPVTERQQGKVRIHLDVTVDDLDAGIARVVSLGGQPTGERHEYDEGVVVVMTDPEGHEFCLAQYLDQSAARPFGVNPVSAAGFGGDMSVYERGRPSYPADAVGWLVDGLGIGAGTTVVDLAAGTGKLTRLLLSTGADVTAVEPSAAMRESFAAAVPGVPVLEGTAESLPLPDASVDAVLVAQAYHWFDVPASTAELARVIRPGGGIGLIWNERDRSVPWVHELNEIFGWNHRERQGVPFTVEVDWREVFAEQAHPRFATLERYETTYNQMMDVDTLVLRVLSTSYIASGPAAEQRRVEAAVRQLVADFPAEFELPYVTHAYRSLTEG